MHFGRCLEILELESADSLEEVKKAYKVLVNVWHPDRFSHDPILKQKAEDKLLEINTAYEQLEAFFTRKNYKLDLDSIEIPAPKPRYAKPKRSVSAPQTAAQPKSSPVQPATASGRRTPAVSARSSSLGKYVFLGFLFGLAVFTVLVIHFLTRMDDSVSNISQKALQTIQEKMTEIGSSAPPPAQKDKIFGKDSVGTLPTSSGSEKGQSAQAEKQCIIYLKGGEYIIAESWWYSGDMVEYRVKHGIVGIEKSIVDDIQCK